VTVVVYGKELFLMTKSSKHNIDKNIT